MVFAYRIMGAAMLDQATFEEIEGDRTATAQAMGVVLLASLSAGIGLGGLDAGHPVSFVFVSGAPLLTWAVWALVTFQVGARLLPEPQTRVDVGELLRTLGFSAAPGLLQVFGVVPGLRGPLFAFTAVWMLASMVVAVRQALDYSTIARAFAVCVIGWLLAFTIAVILGLVYGPTLS